MSYAISKEQLVLMRHMISNGNFFGTEDDSGEECHLDKIVEQGLAIKMRAPKWMIDDVVFRLTEEGKEALKEI